MAAALSPAEILDIRILESEEDGRPVAEVDVLADQFSLAIGKGGQNSRLAAKLTGFKININSIGGQEDEKNEVEEVINKNTTISSEEITENKEEKKDDESTDDK